VNVEGMSVEYLLLSSMTNTFNSPWRSAAGAYYIKEVAYNFCLQCEG
jgi:hypothetical protein